jgi:hypothetical protein
LIPSAPKPEHGLIDAFESSRLAGPRARLVLVRRGRAVEHMIDGSDRGPGARLDLLVHGLIEFRRLPSHGSG